MRQLGSDPLYRPELFLHDWNDCGQRMLDGRGIGNTSLRHVSFSAPAASRGFSNLPENAIRPHSSLTQIIRHDAEKALLSVDLRGEHRDPAAQTVANGIGKSAECPGVRRRHAFRDDPYSFYFSCLFGETPNLTTAVTSHRLVHAFLEGAFLLDE